MFLKGYRSQGFKKENTLYVCACVQNVTWNFFSQCALFFLTILLADIEK